MYRFTNQFRNICVTVDSKIMCNETPDDIGGSFTLYVTFLTFNIFPGLMIYSLSFQSYSEIVDLQVVGQKFSSQKNVAREKMSMRNHGF